MSDNPFSKASAIQRAYARARGLAGLRADYVAGRIEVDEFEEQLDALLRVDPDCLDRKRTRPTNEPGYHAVDEVLKSVYTPPSWYADYVSAIQRESTHS